MILGYLCERCKGVADRVTMAKYTKDEVDFHLGYVCDDCKDAFYKETRNNPSSQWLFEDWTFTYDITDIKSVDLFAIYGKKEEKLHKKF